MLKKKNSEIYKPKNLQPLIKCTGYINILHIIIIGKKFGETKRNYCVIYETCALVKND